MARCARRWSSESLRPDRRPNTYTTAATTSTTPQMAPSVPSQVDVEMSELNGSVNV